jgi:hypothetical protein
MRDAVLKKVLLAVGVLSVLLPSWGIAGQSAEQVNAALAEMHHWVGDKENGIRWKQFLKSEELGGQLALGDAADRSSVAEIYNIYASGTAGLEYPKFASVKHAMKWWLADLPPTAANLSEIAADEHDRFLTVEESDVQLRGVALQSALSRLDSYLSTGRQENAQQWKRYLKWQDLESALVLDGRPDMASLQNVLSAYSAQHVGLELPQFTSVRESLREYISAALFHYRPKIEELFTQRIEELTDHLRKYGETKETDDAVAIGRIVGWLESGNQSTDLIQQVRRVYWQPNLHGAVSQRLMDAGVSDSIDELQNINENILGTSIQGVARMHGQLGLRLVPENRFASFDIEMTGTAVGNNVGYNGPVTIFSYGETQIVATKQIFLDEAGLTSNYASASCSTSSNINSIAARSKLVRKIAWRRAGKIKSQSEAIAARRAEVRVASQVDLQAAEMLADANAQFDEKARSPLIRLNAYPRKVGFRTDDEHLHVSVLHATPYQIAAPESPPDISGNEDLGLRLHESIVANFSESLLGGKTLTDERFVDLLAEAGVEIPEELEITPEKDPWSISFSNSQPISAVFRDGKVRIAIRGRRFTRGEQEIRSTIEISATYRFEKTGSGVRLIREGEVQVEYLNRDRLSVTQVAMKVFLGRKFDAMLEPEIVSEGLVLPGPLERVGALYLSAIESEDRWLTLGWQLAQEAAHTAGIRDLTQR